MQIYVCSRVACDPLFQDCCGFCCSAHYVIPPAALSQSLYFCSALISLLFFFLLPEAQRLNQRWVGP